MVGGRCPLGSAARTAQTQPLAFADPVHSFFLCKEWKLERESGGQPSLPGPAVWAWGSSLSLPLPPAEGLETVGLHSFQSTAHKMGGLSGMPREACQDRATSLQGVGKAHGWCPTSDPFCQLPEPKSHMPGREMAHPPPPRVSSSCSGLSLPYICPTPNSGPGPLD